MSRDASGRLIRALSAHLGPLTSIDHRTTKWSSATFTGTRHIIWCDVGVRDDLDALLQNLPDADLPMPGHFVADIEMVDADVEVAEMDAVVSEAEGHDHAEQRRIGLRALTIAEA